MSINDRMTSIIVDDEPMAIETLSNDLKNYPEIEIVGKLTTMEGTLQKIVQFRPDILFLDVEMPGMSGIELLQQMPLSVCCNMHIIFYSAFDKYIIDALRSAAFDYLLKPYRIEELDNIVKRIKLDSINNQPDLGQVLRQLQNNNTKIAVQTIKCLLLLHRQEILCFQYFDDTRCWQMILTSMEKHRLRSNTKAKDILMLCPDFIRVNPNCILNIDYLSSVENGTLRCILYAPFNNFTIVVSRRHYSKIKETLQML